MKNMIKRCMICISIYIGIVLSGTAHITDAQAQSSSKFTFGNVVYQGLQYDNPDDMNYYSNKLYGSLWSYEKTTNKNNKWGFSYEALATPIRRYQTGKTWADNGEDAIYQGTKIIDNGTIGFARYRSLNYINTVKLYLASALFHSKTMTTLEYINNPAPATETKSHATDIDLDIGLAFYPIETLEVLVSSNYASAIADSDIDDEELESGYEGYDIDIEYIIKGKTKLSVGAYHDNKDLDASSTNIGISGNILPYLAIDVAYISNGDDSYGISFGLLVGF